MCSVQSSKSVLFGHRHLQVGGRKEEREKKKNSNYIGDGACRVEVR